MEIKFYDCNQENLEKIYSDYVDEVTNNHDVSIVTNVLCLVKYKKPKINFGGKHKYIKTEYKLMTSTCIIEWKEGTNMGFHYNYVNFVFGNISSLNVIKFSRMEDINFANC